MQTLQDVRSPQWQEQYEGERKAFDAEFKQARESVDRALDELDTSLSYLFVLDPKQSRREAASECVETLKCAYNVLVKKFNEGRSLAKDDYRASRPQTLGKWLIAVGRELDVEEGLKK